MDQQVGLRINRPSPAPNSPCPPNARPYAPAAAAGPQISELTFCRLSKALPADSGNRKETIGFSDSPIHWLKDAIPAPEMISMHFLVMCFSHELPPLFERPRKDALN